MSAPNNIVFFHYTYSPYARRIAWYLALRGIEYAQCLQPPVMPRADLAALGVKYRRIPVLAIGRDVYCDTRLILKTLEERFPDGALGTTDPEQKGIEKLLERYIIEGPVFTRGVSLIPTSLPNMNDPVFIKDREQMSGRPWGNKETLEKGRPESVAYMRSVFELLETTLLADGRDWILKTDKPSLADIEAVWPLDWLVGMKALPADTISASHFPKVFAWIARFGAAVKAAKAAVPKPVTLKGSDAVQFVLGSDFAKAASGVAADEPLKLKEGDEVELHPTDSGMFNRDRGRLVALNASEVIVAVQSSVKGKEVRVHAPRTGFRVTKVEAGAKL